MSGSDTPMNNELGQALLDQLRAAQRAAPPTKELVAFMRAMRDARIALATLIEKVAPECGAERHDLLKARLNELRSLDWGITNIASEAIMEHDLVVAAKRQ